MSPCITGSLHKGGNLVRVQRMGAQQRNSYSIVSSWGYVCESTEGSAFSRILALLPLNSFPPKVQFDYNLALTALSPPWVVFVTWSACYAHGTFGLLISLVGQKTFSSEVVTPMRITLSVQTNLKLLESFGSTIQPSWPWLHSQSPLSCHPDTAQLLPLTISLYFPGNYLVECGRRELLLRDLQLQVGFQNLLLTLTLQWITSHLWFANRFHESQSVSQHTSPDFKQCARKKQLQSRSRPPWIKSLLKHVLASSNSL